MPTESDILIANGIYSRWCKELPEFSAICGTFELHNCKTSSKERVLNEQDKQLRLVSNPKSKAGRKKSMKVLRKPDTPERRDMKRRLVEGLPTPTKNKKTKKKLESQFKKVKTNSTAASSNPLSDSSVPKRGRGKPRKIAFEQPNLSKNSPKKNK